MSQAETINLVRLTQGQLVIGRVNEKGGVDECFLVSIVPQQDTTQMEIHLRSMFWPFSKDGVNIKPEHVLAVIESTSAQLIQQYLQMKNQTKLEVLSPRQAQQVLNKIKS